MPLGAGLADLCMALAVVPAVVGENPGICALSSLHNTIIQKTHLHMLACFYLYVVFPDCTSYVCSLSVILKSKLLLPGL